MVVAVAVMVAVAAAIFSVSGGRKKFTVRNGTVQPQYVYMCCSSEW